MEDVRITVRNVITMLPWLRFFQEVKVGCIELYGVDIAQSLQVRFQKWPTSTNNKYLRCRLIGAAALLL